MKKFLIPLVTAFFTQLPLEALAQSDLRKEMQMMNQGEKQEAFIAQFAQQAKDRDSAAILKEIDPGMLRENGEAPTLQWLQTTVFPFFENYSKLHNYKQITNATLPDGRAGLWHYTYIMDTNGKALPFSIAIIESTEGLRILNVIVNKCINGRHPPIAACPNTTASQPSQDKPMKSEESIALRTKKLVAIDIFSSVCGGIIPDGIAPLVAKMNQALFPQGEPKDASAIRQSSLYKELYEKVHATAAKDSTPALCAKL